MDNLMSKERILKKIRIALLNKTDKPYPELKPKDFGDVSEEDTLEVKFAEALHQNGSAFVYCEYLVEFVHSLQILMHEKNWDKLYCSDPLLIDIFDTAEFTDYSASPADNVQASISRCEALIAEEGQVLTSSSVHFGQRPMSESVAQIVLATPNQVLKDTAAAMSHMKEKYGDDLPNFIHISGKQPESTSDSNEEIIVFLVEM